MGSLKVAGLWFTVLFLSLWVPSCVDRCKFIVACALANVLGAQGALKYATLFFQCALASFLGVGAQMVLNDRFHRSKRYC